MSLNIQRSTTPLPPGLLWCRVVMIGWPDPQRPFCLWFEVMACEFALPAVLCWEFNGKTQRDTPYWSAGVAVGPLRFRVTRTKKGVKA